jgi:hypothetical protein
MISCLVPIRTCRVSFTDSEGLRHSVDVQAETLYEAAALACEDLSLRMNRRIEQRNRALSRARTVLTFVHVAPS